MFLILILTFKLESLFKLVKKLLIRKFIFVLRL